MDVSLIAVILAEGTAERRATTSVRSAKAAWPIIPVVKARELVLSFVSCGSSAVATAGECRELGELQLVGGALPSMIRSQSRVQLCSLSSLESDSDFSGGLTVELKVQRGLPSRWWSQEIDDDWSRTFVVPIGPRRDIQALCLLGATVPHS